ncbi:MAG: hypothetical protein ABIQ60_00300, partial [Burkholderiaceae bacterium]
MRAPGIDLELTLPQRRLITVPDSNPSSLPLFIAADLQGHLLTATHDLDRLQNLLAHACDELMRNFDAATDAIRTSDERTDADHGAAALGRAVRPHLVGAITALQFQDMASQLIAHTHRRLRHCADRLALQAMGDDDDGAAVV